MGEETRLMMFAAFGGALTLFGAYCVVRKHVPMQAFNNQRKANPILNLRGGPAVLVGLSMALAGLLIAAPLVLGLLEGETRQLESMSIGPAILILAVGGLTGAGWQIVRNVVRTVGSDEVQNKMAENLQRAVREARAEREKSHEEGIDPR